MPTVRTSQLVQVRALEPTTWTVRLILTATLVGGLPLPRDASLTAVVVIRSSVGSAEERLYVPMAAALDTTSVIPYPAQDSKSLEIPAQWIEIYARLAVDSDEPIIVRGELYAAAAPRFQVPFEHGA